MKGEKKIHRRVKYGISHATGLVVCEVILDGRLLIRRHREDVAESPTTEDDLIARDFRIGYRGPWIYLRCSYRGDVRAS